MKVSELFESADQEQKRLEKMVRAALKDGDDYTAKQYAKMAPTPEGKKALAKIIRDEMHAVPEGLSEGFEAELTDAIKFNWMSWSVSKIVDILKKQIKTGKWPELKGKSDDELHDYVDSAKDNARNQIDEAHAGKGMWVIKNKDGVEKRFKDDESPEAKAWKNSNSPKRRSPVPKEKFSKEWWQYQEDNDKTYEKIMPWTKIDKYDLDSASLKNAFADAGWQEKNIDDWSVIGRGTEINIKGVPCAAVEIRVVYVFTKDDDMGIEGDEPVSDSGSFFAARSPKDPKKYIFARFGN